MARLPKGMLVTQSEVSQTIDLSEAADVDLTGQEDLKAEIAQALIDKIVKRTESGKDLRGNSFDAYPKSYRESDSFEAFGKSRKVNMTLSGGMLSLLEPNDTGGSEVKLGWNDVKENAKAFNHMTGDTVKKRQFFGLKQEDIKEVLTGFDSELESLREEQSTETASSAVTSFLNNVNTTSVSGAATAVINIRDIFGESEG